MLEITLQIAQVDKKRLLDSYCTAMGFTSNLASEQKDFLKSSIINYIKSVVKAYESDIALEKAKQAVAQATPTPEIIIT